MSDREEKLRAAREKLDKFRRKRSNMDSPSPVPSQTSQKGDTSGLSSYFGMDQQQSANSSNNASTADFFAAPNPIAAGSNDIFSSITAANPSLLSNVSQASNLMQQDLYARPSYSSGNSSTAMVKVGLEDVFITYAESDTNASDPVNENEENVSSNSSVINNGDLASQLAGNGGNIMIPETVQNFHQQQLNEESWKSTIEGYKEEISNLELLLQKERSEKEFAMRDLHGEQIEKSNLLQELERVRGLQGGAPANYEPDREHVTNLTQQLSTLQADIVTKNNTLELVVAEKSELESKAETNILLIDKDPNTNYSLMKAQYLGEQCRLMLQEKQALTQEIDSLRAMVNECKAKADENTTSSVAVQETNMRAMTLQNDLEDLKTEKSELELKLKRVCEEQNKERQQIKLLSSELEMTKVHLTQLRGVGTDASQSQQITSLTEQLKESRNSLASVSAARDKLAMERDRQAEQYRSYSKDLASQAERLSEQVRRYQDENARLIHRESGLVGQIEQMEKQLQKYVQGGKNITEEENTVLKEKCMMLETDARQAREAANKLEQMYTDRSQQVEDVMKRLAVKESKLNELATVISELQNSNEMLKSQAGETQIRPEILAAMESDKVAASRAMQQNNSMKLQIEELQKELVNLINSKAKAIDELEDYKRRVKKLGAADSEIKALQEALGEREGIIAGLRNQIKYLESQISLHQNRDDSPGGQRIESGHEKELEEALNTIRSLNSINSELRSQLEVLSSQTREGSEARTNNSSPGSPTMANRTPDELNLGHEQTNSHSATSSSCDMDQTSSSVSTSSESFVEVHHVDHQDMDANTNQNFQETQVEKAEEAQEGSENITESGSEPCKTPLNKTLGVASMKDNIVSPNLDTWKKLEERFISAMNRVAALSSDKEQLEHLVARLQDETDTITDYIIMYQHQRKQQKLRLQEKEEQLQQLARDKSNLQTKLSSLHHLVEELLHHQDQDVPETLFENSTIPNDTSAHVNGQVETTSEDKNTTENPQTDLEENQENNEGSENERKSPLPSVEGSPTKAAKRDAKKIFQLLTEIQAESKQLGSSVENFQPFFFDSSNGKVITV